MTFWEVFMASITASVWPSWIALPFLVVSMLCIALASAPGSNRRRYLIAGLIGGIVGEFCAVYSLFFSLLLFCRAHPSCNTAQGDMGLIYLIPLGTSVGTLLTSGFTWVTFKIARSIPSSRRPIWICSILAQLTFYVETTWLLAHLMA